MVLGVFPGRLECEVIFIFRGHCEVLAVIFRDLVGNREGRRVPLGSLEDLVIELAEGHFGVALEEVLVVADHLVLSGRRERVVQPRRPRLVEGEHRLGLIREQRQRLKRLRKRAIEVAEEVDLVGVLVEVGEGAADQREHGQELLLGLDDGTLGETHHLLAVLLVPTAPIHAHLDQLLEAGEVEVLLDGGDVLLQEGVEELQRHDAQLLLLPIQEPEDQLQDLLRFVGLDVVLLDEGVGADLGLVLNDGVVH
mmetsp:Transcript_41773/g.40117  ORF Transcript_41773/g.40117 Transcript_41773/m.40117 type:complete len:252 (-) Transcript_41773:1604-2359(-)